MYNHTASKSHRPQGSNIDVIMWARSCDERGAIERAKDVYNLEDEKTTPKQIPQQAIDYIKSR
jgi:hypothetical protein